MRTEKSVYLFLLPVLILFSVFVFIPLVEGFRISFTNWNGYSQIFKYIGFDNYVQLFQSSLFKTAIINTLMYGFICTFIQNILGLCYALFVDKKFALRNLVRLIIYLPAMIAGVIMGYMMYGIFQYNGGALNDALELFGFSGIDWLSHGTLAVWIIIIVNSLQFVGVSMLLYLAGLQGIPKSYIEAARLDGASSFQIFRNIRLPLLIPAITASVLINMIGGLKLFSIIYALTNGGPGNATQSMGTAIEYLHFSNENAGQAAAAGILLFILVFVVSLIINIYLNRKEVEMQ